MYSTDLDIYEDKDKGIYSLMCDGRAIKCLCNDDPVASEEESIIEFIRGDFDRCGSIKIKENRIHTNGINCAYHIFSIQKFKVEDERIYKDLLSSYRVFPKYDYALIQTANGPPLETEEIARLAPTRNALINQIEAQ